MDEYRDLIEELAEAGRDAVGRGLVSASGGNLSSQQLRQHAATAVANQY